MPGKHKDTTIAFRPSEWARAVIEQRAALSGMYKKDFITRSCVYSNIVVVGKRENVQRIVDALQEMQIVMKEIAGQIQSGSFSLQDESYQELKRDYLALVVTVADIAEGAAYLFDKKSPAKRRNWKAELELEQYCYVLGLEGGRKMQLKKGKIHDMIFYEKEGEMMGAGNQADLKRQETLKAIETLSLLDDDLMTLAFDRNIEATELLLNVILQRDDLKVLEVAAQREYKNPMSSGRSIIIDIYAEDREGKVYDIEVQRASAGADGHRARFHSSMIDMKMLKAGQEFKEIHDSYVIFITASDVIGAGCPLYHVDRVIKETGVYFGDGSHIIYVNGSYKDDSNPIGKLVHDFRCMSSVDMFYPELAKQVKYFKETEGGREIMCQVFEELAEKRAEETRIETLFHSIKNLMKSMKWTAEQAMVAMDISENDQILLKSKF